MNRIILIGNGFDLAHGLKTKYEHFINDFWNRKKEEVLGRQGFNNDRRHGYTCYEDDTIRIKISHFNDDIAKVQRHLKNEWYKRLQMTAQNGYDWLETIKEPIRIGDIGSFETIVEHKNVFLENISKRVSSRSWVDIEEEYYLALNRCLNDENGRLVERLNREFLFITNELKNYLRRQVFVEMSELTGLRENIYSDINPDTSLNKILFLNFNYTSTEKQYVSNDQQVSDVIHIHGDLENPDNPIIFGYGDDTGEEYRNIKNKNDNRYLENIKQTKYLETDNYEKLLRFVESDEYEMFIMGHSCGISDRVLLNKIFMHENCLSIKIFYHKRSHDSDDHSNIIRNMLRNVADEASLMKKIVSKNDSVPLGSR